MRIVIESLNMKYQKTQALNDVCLNIDTGMFGLLGPNGAGKTTLMKILATLLNKTSGEVTIDGVNVENKKEIRNIIGYLPQEFSFYPFLTVYEVMDYLCLLSNIKVGSQRRKIICDLIELVNLTDNIKTKVKKLSGGMKRRLGIAQALITNPTVLIVDEPTAGLDPEERIRFRNLLSTFSKDKIVLLSTHIVSDVEQICDNIAVINKGTIVFSGRTNDIINKAKGFIWSIELDARKWRDSEYLNPNEILSIAKNDDIVKIRYVSKEPLFDKSVLENASLEDAYMYLIKGND